MVLETAVLSLLLAFVLGVAGFNLLTFAVAFHRPPRPARLALAFAREMLASLALIPAWPLFAIAGARYEARVEGRPADGPPGRPARSRRPVVLLHGYLMNRTNWLWLGWVLARRGVGPLFGLSYLTLQGVPWGARRLARFVEELCARERCEQVDIVAHSMGGLVARHYIEQLGGAGRVRTLVTIATPHRGTSWARVALGHARRDLAAPAAAPPPGGPPAGVRYTSIWSRCDNLVVPADSAHLADEVVFDDLGHLSLLVSPRVADAVADRLVA